MAVPLLLLPFVGGCGGTEQSSPENQRPPFEGQTLSVVVVNDAALAQAIKSVSGEWRAETGAELRVVESELSSADEEGTFDADVVVFPSGELGTLAERGEIFAPSDSLTSAPELRWTDIFELVRLQEVMWGDRVTALPLGSPGFVCIYRPDVLKSLNRQPPRTWAEYQELVQLIAVQHPAESNDPSSVGWRASMEPLAEGWAGLTLLTRAVAYAMHRDQFSTFFDIDSMEPLIDSEPFVRALQELVAAAQPDPSAALALTPTTSCDAVNRGECALAIGWPVPANSSTAESATRQFEIGFCELPGSAEAYNRQTHAWEPRREAETTQVPLTSVTGRLIAIGKGARNRNAAEQLLVFLASEPWCTRLACSTEGATLCRQSQATHAAAWVPPFILPEAAGQYVEAVRAAMSRQVGVSALRIPGRREYLSALDAAVRRTVQRDGTPEDNLKQAAATWREITTRLGLDAQRLAYQRSLGLLP